MVLLQVSQLFSQTFNLHLQVSLAKGQLIQHPAQAIDVRLHALAQGYLILVPKTSRAQTLDIQEDKGIPAYRLITMQIQIWFHVMAALEIHEFM